MFTTISTNQLRAKFSSKGAELISLQSLDNRREYIWEGNPEIWGKHAPILFPIVGSLKNNQYMFEQATFELPRHGFARDYDFEIVDLTENKVSFLLKSDIETIKNYPFHFELTVTYTLHENTLGINYQISNKNNFLLPFSVGAHPAFALTDKFENYSLVIESNENISYHLLEDGLISNQCKELKPVGKNIFLNYDLFKNDALVIKNVAFKNIQINHNNKPFLKVNFQDFEHLGLWTKFEAPFLCIEPWMGYSDTVSQFGSILDKEAIQILQPFANKNYQYSIEIL